MAAQPALELDIRRPCTYAAGIAAGLRPAQLRGKRFRRLFTGVYVAAEVAPSPFQRVEAALLIHPPPAFASTGTGAAGRGSATTSYLPQRRW